MVLLTKVDKICSEVYADTSKIFKSSVILDQVKNISQLLGIPENQILPIKNYITEIEPNDDVSILALLNLRHLLNATEDYMDNVLDNGHRDSDDASGLDTKD